MRKYAWAAVGFVVLAIVVYLMAYWGNLFLLKATTYPIASVGTYSGTPITAYAATSGGANRYMSFEAPTGTDYQVPVGKSLVITRLIYKGAAIGDMAIIGYGDDAVANGAAAPTNPVSLMGQSGVTPTSSLVVEAVNLVHDIAVYLSIPAGKYPFIQYSGTASSVQLIGAEQ